MTSDESSMVIRSIETVGGFQTLEASLHVFKDLNQASMLFVDERSISLT